MPPEPPPSPSMLNRVCEPISDDPPYEAKVYREMDHSEVNRRFVSDLFSGGPIGRRVIDLGCGPALILIMLCERADTETLAGGCSPSDSGPGASIMQSTASGEEAGDLEVLGVDNSAEMLELARIEIELAGRLGQIQLQQIDLDDAEALQEGLADTVICNTVLHHLDDPSTAVRLAISALRPGGRLFIRDLTRPGTDADVERLVALHGGVANEDPAGISPPQLLRQSLHASLTLGEIRDLVSEFGIPPDCVKRTSDRHWTLDWCRPSMGTKSSPDVG